MTFIETFPEPRLDDPAREAYGYVPNFVRLFSQRPGVWAAWRALLGAIRADMDARRYELATVAAAKQVRSSYCVLAHGSVLMDEFMGADELQAIVTDHRAAGLDAIDVAVMDLAARIADDAGSVTQADVDRLRDLGLSDAEIFDVVATAAARCFFTKLVDGLGAHPDRAYADLDPDLREVMVVGRPIEGG
jgi:uncharacterized peroxidase-related enzyme